MSLAKPGDVLGDRYEIVRVLGKGSMAEVFWAKDRKLERDVALKIVNTPLGKNPETQQRLARETSAQSLIEHNNVAHFYGSGVTAEDRPFLVMELLRGRSLRHVIKNEGAIFWVKAASYIWQGLQGLAAAHNAGVVHRDLKPANFMLEPSPGPVERVILIDFGFAFLQGNSRITTQGHVVGSLGYLAPERLQGAVGDPRSDVYSMGTVLFELLTGQRPYLASNDVDLVHQLLEAPAPSLHDFPQVEGIPPGFDHIVQKALEKSPGQRFQTAQEMASAIESATQ